MIRAPRLAVSRPMYAFRPNTWRPSGGYGFEVDAVWFKRKSGVLTATMGSYHPMVECYEQRPADLTYEPWITAADDNRYGGSHLASWDGEALVCSDQRVPPALQTERIAFLTGVLAGFPHVPAGYDGWWTFPRGGTR